MIRTSVSLVGFLLLLAPTLAAAHETQQFRIGDKEYSFVIGSLNEPVTVDDKTGVDLTVSLVGAEEAHDDHEAGATDDHAAAAPVMGLEATLKVELQAGDAKKELPLTTQYGKPGSYKAVFFPTVQTTYTYRLFGTIEDQAIDLSFTCNPAGHPATPEDTAEVEVSENVTRTLKKGAFGCPAAKADLGFPEPAATMVELKDASGSDVDPLSVAGVVLGGLGLIIGGIALSRKRSA